MRLFLLENQRKNIFTMYFWNDSCCQQVYNFYSRVNWSVTELLIKQLTENL